MSENISSCSSACASHCSLRPQPACRLRPAGAAAAYHAPLSARAQSLPRPSGSRSARGKSCHWCLPKASARLLCESPKSYAQLLSHARLSACAASTAPRRAPRGQWRSSNSSAISSEMRREWKSEERALAELLWRRSQRLLRLLCCSRSAPASALAPPCAGDHREGRHVTHRARLFR